MWRNIAAPPRKVKRARSQEKIVPEPLALCLHVFVKRERTRKTRGQPKLKISNRKVAGREA